MDSAMTMAPTQSHFLPHDVLRLEEEGLFELVDGKLVEKEMSSLATKTASVVVARLFSHIEKSHAGELYSEQTFQCFPHDENLIRRPDIAFIAADRLGGVPEEGHVPIAPDLAIEVVSPNDLVYNLDEKLADYHAAGIKLVWVVNPKIRTLRIHRLDRTGTDLAESDTLSGESILPGFSIVVKDLLPLPNPPAAAAPAAT
jgi:Uma2 family endonuclease